MVIEYHVSQSLSKCTRFSNQLTEIWGKLKRIVRFSNIPAKFHKKKATTKAKVARVVSKNCFVFYYIFFSIFLLLLHCLSDLFEFCRPATIGNLGRCLASAWLRWATEFGAWATSSNSVWLGSAWHFIQSRCKLFASCPRSALFSVIMPAGSIISAIVRNNACLCSFGPGNRSFHCDLCSWQQKLLRWP